MLDMEAEMTEEINRSARKIKKSDVIAAMGAEVFEDGDETPFVDIYDDLFEMILEGMRRHWEHDAMLFDLEDATLDVYNRLFLS